MPLLRIPPSLDAAPHVEPKPSTALKTIAAEIAGHTCAEWMREALLLHLKRPTRKEKSAPDPTLLAEILGLRSLVQNLIAAASDLPEETDNGMSAELGRGVAIDGPRGVVLEGRGGKLAGRFRGVYITEPGLCVPL